MKKVLTIEGMSCGHCAGHTKKALEAICGVQSVDVDLLSKTATVELAHDVEDDKFKSAIDEVGYEVVSIN